MKNLIIIPIVFFLSSARIWSQTDTLMVTEEEFTADKDKYDRVYKLFIEDKDKEIKHLWKLSLTGIALFYPEISFEQSLGKRWTSETGAGFGTPYYLLSYNTLKEIGESNLILGSNINQGFKFFYNIDRRNRLGKRTNGFSANYFAFVFSAEYEFSWNDYYTDDTWRINGGIQYGLQRRIGNIGYVEGFTGIRISYKESTWVYDLDDSEPTNIFESDMVVEPYLGLKAGFAISSFRNLKKMIK